MKIAVDVDGVLFDNIENFVTIFNRRYNTQYTKKDVTQWEFYLDWKISEEEFFEIFFKSYEMSDIFIDSNAPKYMKELNLVHKVYIVSARTNQKPAQIVEKLEHYNIKTNIHYRDLILVANRPNDSKKHHHYDVYVDDNPNLAKAIKETKDRYLLLYDQPWNQSFECKDNIIRVYNWKEVYEIIQKL